jgi:hypothetical protein
MLELMKERGVRKMATTATLVTAKVVPVREPLTVEHELPLEARLKRQRAIIHARRGELKRFLSPRETPFEPFKSTLQMVGTAEPKVPSARQEMLVLERRLKTQREIIHARRGELKRFLSPR